MKWGGSNLFSLPMDEIDFTAVRAFILRAEEIDALSESTTIELKSKRDGTNVVDALAGLCNTDGGLVRVGVDEKVTGEDRLVGVAPKHFEALRDQIGQMLPQDAQPEIVPVKIPDKDEDRLIVVLRADADRAHHPVVCRGRVMVRAPGETVRASREQIIQLVDRGRQYDTPDTTVEPSFPHASLPFSWRSMAFWGSPPLLDFRMSGGLRLPHRARRQPWLRTRAKEAMVESLNQSPIPGRLHSRPLRDFELPSWFWQIEDARATYVTMRAHRGRDLSHRWIPSLQSAAHVQVSGRSLNVVIAIGLYPDDDGTETRLGIDDLFEWLLGAPLAIDSVCDAVAEALDIRDPSSTRPFEGSLENPSGPASDHLYPNRSSYTIANDVRGFLFPSARPRPSNAEGLAALAREWLTILLLDSGASHFEEALDQLELPAWLS